MQADREDNTYTYGRSGGWLLQHVRILGQDLFCLVDSYSYLVATVGYYDVWVTTRLIPPLTVGFCLKGTVWYLGWSVGLSLFYFFESIPRGISLVRRLQSPRQG